jgi:hypothetical protein
MADKPSADHGNGSFRADLTPDLDGQAALPPDFEVRLRSTERIRLVLQRCERCCAPHHLLIRIHEILISVSTRDGSSPQ